MHKKTIEYTDYDGNKVVEEFHFNLSRSEIAELETTTPGGLRAQLEYLTKVQDGEAIMNLFKRLILGSIGIKSANAKRFIKSDEIREDFYQSEAYTELFMELMSDPDKAGTFLNAIIPQAPPQEQPMVPQKQGTIIDMKR